MRKKLTDMRPVDDFVTRNTPGLKIWDENWGGMQCAYHIFAPGTDFTDILKGKGLEHDLCGVEHWAYVLKGSVEVIYLDGTIEICRAGEVCFWPAPHNFKSKEGAEILQFSTAGGLAEQGKRVQDFVAKQMRPGADHPARLNTHCVIHRSARVTGWGLPQMAGPAIAMEKEWDAQLRME